VTKSKVTYDIFVTAGNIRVLYVFVLFAACFVFPYFLLVFLYKFASVNHRHFWASGQWPTLFTGKSRSIFFLWFLSC